MIATKFNEEKEASQRSTSASQSIQKTSGSSSKKNLKKIKGGGVTPVGADNAITGTSHEVMGKTPPAQEFPLHSTTTSIGVEVNRSTSTFGELSTFNVERRPEEYLSKLPQSNACPDRERHLPSKSIRNPCDDCFGDHKFRIFALKNEPKVYNQVLFNCF